jgi:hypothetical protein
MNVASKHWSRGPHADNARRVQQSKSPVTWEQPPTYQGGPVDGYAAAMLMHSGVSAERICELVAKNGGRVK